MGSDGQGRLVQAQLRTALQPAQLVGRPGLRKKAKAVMHILAALRQRSDFGLGGAQ